MTGILIIEADASARQATVALVRRLAPMSAVEGVATLDQAWQAIGRLLPELVIVDPAPYGVHGELLLHMVRDLSPATRVLVLTAMHIARRSVRTLPADTVAEKRLSPPQLRDIIRAALER